ncbi:MAG: methyltransferase domain-containing protein, partial [Chloroflexi bacterium]|nr:methyltransferase domain-containing protein [Chloroflexota bacterium]
ELPIRAETLDCVLTFNAIHDFPLPGFLQESHRVLKDGGYLFIYTRSRSQNQRTVWGRHFPRSRRRRAGCTRTMSWPRRSEVPVASILKRSGGSLRGGLRVWTGSSNKQNIGIIRPLASTATKSSNGRGNSLCGTSENASPIPGVSPGMTRICWSSPEDTPSAMGAGCWNGMVDARRNARPVAFLER